MEIFHNKFFFFRFGGTDADSIKSGIDHVYRNIYKMPEDDYTNKVISATSDGASVNTGIYRGVLTQLKFDRDWLVSMHCVNHRIELGVKEAFGAEPLFDEVDEFYIGIFYYLKQSGAVKAEVKQAAEFLGITYYVLPKVHGTRFVSHRHQGYSKFIHMWPALITAFENSKVTAKTNTKRAKLEGYLRKLRNVKKVF